MLKCLMRCSWSAWIVYHNWKLQIRKEIREAESEKEKSYSSTDQYFGREAGRMNFGEKNLYFPFSNGSLNSLLGLEVMFLLYGMNIQCDSF